MNLWPHQEFAIEQCLGKILFSDKPHSMVVSCNTGGGKTKIMTEIIIRSLMRTSLYTHRKMLLSQTSKVLTEAGISHGIMAAGYEPKPGKVQLCSIQTIDARAIRIERMRVHPSDIILIDEAHANKSATMVDILAKHEGAHVIGFSATPMEIGHIYDHIIQAGSTSSLRDCGALLSSHHYGCPEMGMGKIQPGASGEFSAAETAAAFWKGGRAKRDDEGTVIKLWRPPVIFGHVLEHFRQLNPENKPAILFAPGVAESQYMAEHFFENGIPAGHISSTSIWINGSTYEATQENRDVLARMSKSGEIKVVCNRFVMREGIDWPWLAHLIFATPFGSLCSYLQSGGRVLRNYPGLDHVTIQDHGGNWWRHGSLNIDREFDLTSTPNMVRRERMVNIREKKEPEPITCWKCYRIRLSGKQCPYCGQISSDKRRAIIQTNGTLKRMQVGEFKPRTIDTRPDIQKRWESQYFRGQRSQNKLNFNQIEALYAMDNQWRWPPRNLPLMPKKERDWHKPVCEVPAQDLI